jgi:hypothetical protein
MPLLGAYVADQYWGRFRTIQVSIGIALVGHVILIISAIPAVTAHPSGAIAVFALGIVIMGIGVGGFKSNISPLIAEQCEILTQPANGIRNSILISTRHRNSDEVEDNREWRTSYHGSCCHGLACIFVLLSHD